jgi:hypothetical protein
VYCDNHKIVFFLKILVVVTNLALGRRTLQSSYYRREINSSLAVDGNHDSNWHHNSCIHTKDDAHPWWSVDIGNAGTRILGVFVTNRGDSNG